MDAITVVDIAPFLQGEEGTEGLCKAVADSLYRSGCVIIRDPRVTEEDNKNFLNMMERYYSQEHEKKAKDARPDVHYQVGVTPEMTEVPRDHTEKADGLATKPHKPTGPDPKWRFHWRIGPRPANTKFPELNAQQVIPEGFPEWRGTMDSWGHKMVDGLNAVAEMAAVGFGLERTTFTDRLKNGPHLLAPTGSDLSRFNQEGTIFAGFHYDLNFLTIHGKSRFPGLYVWLRDGSRVLVRVPEGCLLLQAGKQFEYITGGEVMAGFHEVVVTKETHAAMEKAKAEGRPLWRVSSTCFGHLASDQELKPLEKFSTPEREEKYPPLLVGEQVQKELEAINLAAA